MRVGALALRWRQRRWRIAEGNAGIGARESGLKKGGEVGASHVHKKKAEI